MSGFSAILPKYKDASDGSPMYLQYIIASLNLISNKLESEELLYPQKKSEKSKILVDIAKIKLLKSCLLAINIKDMNALMVGISNSITIDDSLTQKDYENIFCESFHKMFRQTDVCESLKNPMKTEVAYNNTGGSKLTWEDGEKTIEYEIIEDNYSLNSMIDSAIHSSVSDYLWLALYQICYHLYNYDKKGVS
jgi:putative NADH-flavin reductase